MKVFWSAVLEMGFVRYPDGDSGMFPDCLDDHLTGAYVFVNLIWIYKKIDSFRFVKQQFMKSLDSLQQNYLLTLY